MTRWLLALALYSGAAPAQTPNPAYAPVEETPGLPRVLLIGDSISIGYTLPVRELLKGKVNLLRVPNNASTTRFTLERIDGWLGEAKWDLIHFNWGLHDLKIMEDGKNQVPLDEYARNLDLLMTRLKRTGARLIFATTTPVPEGKVTPLRLPADVGRYNEAAVSVMKRRGIAVNDLGAAVLPGMGTLQRPVNVHFTEEGSRFLAGVVAGEVLRLLALE